MQAISNPLIVSVGQLDNREEILPDSTVEVYASISNQGDRNAVLDLAIDVADEASLPLLDWIVPRRVRLQLPPQAKETVLFQVFVPGYAEPNRYHYSLVVDSPEHYPEHTPLQAVHSLNVVSASIVPYQAEAPAISLSPATNATQPRTLKPGEMFEIEILIDNRTQLVDRFHVICTDLDPEYFSIRYPEVNDQYGLVAESDGLELNPGKQGTVLFQIHPPSTAIAGNYFPTLRVQSANDSLLNLLDVIYLHIPPVYDVGAEIVETISRIKNPKTESGHYRIAIANQGNLERTLLLSAKASGWGKLLFTLDEYYTHLQPGDRSEIDLSVKPEGKWWNRPFFGIGKTFTFNVELEDKVGLPLSPPLLEGNLLWEAYPRKKLIFWIILLAVFGLISVSALVFLLWQYFLKQPPNPHLTQFSSPKRTYQESKNEAIQLNWSIRHPKQLSKVTIVQQSSTNSETKSYDFSKGIPPELTPKSLRQTTNFCNYEQQAKDEVLICRGIVTEAREPGNYQYEIQTFNKTKSKQKQTPETQKTDTIRIAPAPLPKITELTSARDSYIESQSETGNPVLLNWEITNPGQLEQIQVVGLRKNGTIASPLQRFAFDKGKKLPPQLSPYCKLAATLSCRNVPTNARKADLYTFRLTMVTKRKQDDPSFSKTTDTIEVKADPSKKAKPGLKKAKTPGGQTSSIDASIRSIEESTVAPVGENPKSANSKLSQDADSLALGLEIMMNSNQIKPDTGIWWKIQKSISLLRSGQSREEAAKQAQIPVTAINRLIKLGQKSTLEALQIQRVQRSHQRPSEPQRVFQSPSQSAPVQQANSLLMPEWSSRFVVQSMN
jgi:hypothetical protein